MSDWTTFLGAMWTAPSGVGAIAPSSPALARQMVSCASISDGDVIVEVGAGTGPMTRALVDAHPNNPLLVLEPDARLAGICRERVPEATVYESYAQELPKLLEEAGHAGADCVVSSLPFAGWPVELQSEVLDTLRAILRPGGRMVTFTYLGGCWLPAGRRARALLEERFATVDLSPVVWRNLPPAFVYTCACSELYDGGAG